MCFKRADLVKRSVPDLHISNYGCTGYLAFLIYDIWPFWYPVSGIKKEDCLSKKSGPILYNEKKIQNNIKFYINYPAGYPTE